jgi:hypothetical protein
MISIKPDDARNRRFHIRSIGISSFSYFGFDLVESGFSCDRLRLLEAMLIPWR